MKVKELVEKLLRYNQENDMCLHFILRDNITDLAELYICDDEIGVGECSDEPGKTGLRVETIGYGNMFESFKEWFVDRVNGLDGVYCRVSNDGGVYAVDVFWEDGHHTISGGDALRVTEDAVKWFRSMESTGTFKRKVGISGDSVRYKCGDENAFVEYYRKKFTGNYDGIGITYCYTDSKYILEFKLDNDDTYTVSGYNTEELDSGVIAFLDKMEKIGLIKPKKEIKK